MGTASLIRREDAVLVLVDLQERLAVTMPRRAEVVANALFLACAAEVLGVPVLVTRQYPKGLGDTLAELAGVAGSAEPIDKRVFDCTRDQGFADRLAALGRRQVLLAGMEAHICIAQTALGLLGEGHEPVVIADAVCSRHERDAEVAIERLRAAGVVVTTAEAAVYELLREAGTAEFKAVLELVKARG
ncbi:MAG: isochorismatase family protein [Coriobacteriia bacterium]